MGFDVIQFVDSIASSPTVRLDINDGSTWRTTSFAAPPPRLRRAMSSNAMRDGINVSSSQYDARTITLGLTLVHTTEDNKATELQKLARELDRETNFLRYQPTGATKPVFFRLYRSDMSQLEQFTGTPSAIAKPTIELLAEPFFLGLRETLGPFTVNNDPAAGSNGHYFDVTGVIGDVAVPFIFVNTGTHNGNGTIALRQHGTPSDMASWMMAQAESCTLGTDTTNPGGGPDAAMSGTGTNNFVRTSFATAATMTTRITKTLTLSDAAGLALRGKYRLLAVVRRSDNTSVMTAQGSIGTTLYTNVGPIVTIPLTTSRQLVDLGAIVAGAPIERVGRYGAVEIPSLNFLASIAAARSSGAGTLDFDYFILLPADESYLTFDGLFNTTAEMVVDGTLESAYQTEDGIDPFLATSSAITWWFSVTGGFPSLVPNQTNRVFYVIGAHTAGPGNVINKADVATVSVHYWPRYVFVRPSAT